MWNARTLSKIFKSAIVVILVVQEKGNAASAFLIIVPAESYRRVTLLKHRKEPGTGALSTS
ncbi:MAG: hypothetical protein PWQ27_1753 [Kosmotoga sp.]|nr:hypothetical protein [Kosmotoga sp.]